MDKAIKRLRRKYIISASAISSGVVVLMLIILNVLMNITYFSQSDAMLDIILRNQSGYDFRNESFILDKMPVNPDGDYIIPRSIESIDSVTLAGVIESRTNDEDWYNAGGGLMFEISESDSAPLFAYREYAFNKDTKEVTIDFTDLDNLKYENDIRKYEKSMVTPDNFLVSAVWWASSDKGSQNARNNITLSLNSIRIHYKYNMVFIPHTNYAASFNNEVPDILSSRYSFSVTADNSGCVLAVNDGNLPSGIDDNEASDLVRQVMSINKSSSVIKTVSGPEYYYVREKNEQQNIIAFIRTNSEYGLSGHLLAVSVISGILILILIYIIIVIVSGKVVRPVYDTFEKQKQFISNAGHELKTPITVISATTDLIEKKTGPDRWTDCIKAQSEKMSRLVNEMLELSRLSETHNCRLQFEKFNFSRTAANTVLYFESMAYEEKHQLCSDIDDDITFYGDENRIERLIGILIDNALKYADKNGKVSITAGQTKDKIFLKCINTCSSLTSAQTDHLFERFYRCECPGYNERPGYGLGLSIAQAITELHNGSIDVSYKDGIVTFTITLPC